MSNGIKSTLSAFGIALVLCFVAYGVTRTEPMNDSASCAQVERFSLLGIYKPKGIAIIFDTATGTVSTTPLPQSLVQGSDQQ